MISVAPGNIFQELAWLPQSASQQQEEQKKFCQVLGKLIPQQPIGFV